MANIHKTAIVTGASQGIGAALVEAFFETWLQRSCELAKHYESKSVPGVRKAFIQRVFIQSELPIFAHSYDEADIDWTAGSVKIPRKRERFCPTFLCSDFDRYFFKERDAPRS